VVMMPLKPKQNVPGILRLHGGGFHMGRAEDDVLYCREFIEIADCVCVSPDYRLSTEAPYPAALEDCYTALLWLKSNATRLGVRTDQIAVTGASAGGGLTAALTLYARDKGEVNIAFQMPLCPMIDDRMQTPSAKDNDAPVWDHVSCKSSWQVYLGDLFGTDKVPIYAAPARATDYSKLPPTFTYTGSIEIFRDETVQYVENLRAAGVPAEIEIYEGCYHGFDAIVPKADASKRFAARRKEWFLKAVREYFAAQKA
jgi:acetyl esterase/lipase